MEDSKNEVITKPDTNSLSSLFIPIIFSLTYDYKSITFLNDIRAHLALGNGRTHFTLPAALSLYIYPFYCGGGGISGPIVSVSVGLRMVLGCLCKPFLVFRSHFRNLLPKPGSGLWRLEDYSEDCRD